MVKYKILMQIVPRKSKDIIMQKDKTIKGVKIKSFNSLMIVVACVLYAMLIYATTQMTSRYNEFIRYNEEYMS